MPTTLSRDPAPPSSTPLRADDGFIDSAAGEDLSPLAWVHDELRRTLDSAQKLLRRFLRETESHAGSDVSARDLGALRQARSLIHQGAGALAAVGLAPAAQVLSAGDAALRAALEKPAKLDAALLEKIEQASFAVVDYLGREVAGKPVSSLLLFPQARALLEAAGADRVHPADLWGHVWQWQALPADKTVNPRAADAQSLSALEQLTLATMKTPGPASLTRMSDLCAELAAGAKSPHGTGLWQLAAAVFQAQAQGLLVSDVFSKRLASRLLSQLRARLRGDGRKDGPGDATAEQRLAHDLLFFCAQSQPPDAARPAPRLSAVRAAYGLTDAAPVDYTTSPLGRFDPALVVQARKRVQAAKDSWSALAAGDMQRLSGLIEQFSLVGDSLRRLLPDGLMLAEELQQAGAQLQRGAAPPRAALAMEVATGLLYVEAALEEADFATPAEQRPIARLAERIAAVRAGGPPEAMEHWMEALYARVSDRQTLGTVVQELRASLASAEQQIDQFFRNPRERGALLPVPATLQAMRGVLSVLGMDQAALALQHMREEVDALAAGPGPDPAPDAGPQQPRFERLADNLGALGFLIDMLGVQAHLAKAMFRYDAHTGVFAPVMGRGAAARVPAPDSANIPVLQDLLLAPEVAPAVIAPQAVVSAAPPTVTLAVPEAPTPKPAPTAPPAEDHAATQALMMATQPIALPDFPTLRLDATQPIPAPVPAAMPAPAVPAAAAPAALQAADPEMRAVFFEEAQEVLQAARDALGDWDAAPREPEPVVRLRRAFHTLKGSARMVGLADFGAAAWDGEQRYNARLADNAPAHDRLGNDVLAATDAGLRGWTAAELDRLAGWVAHLVAGGEGEPAEADDTERGEFEATVSGIDLDLNLDWGDAAAGGAEVSEVIVATVPGSLSGLVLDGEGDAPAEEPTILSLEPDTLEPDELEVDEFELAAPAPEPVSAHLPPAFAPLGFPPDLPTAADLDLGPLENLRLDAAPPPPPSPPAFGPVPTALDDEPWVEDIGRSLTPPAPPVDLSFLSLDLSEPLPTAPVPEAAPAAAEVPPAAPPPISLAVPAAPIALPDPGTVRELDPLDDPALLALFDELAEPDHASAAPPEPAPPAAALTDIDFPADPADLLIDLAIDAAPLAEVTELDALPQDIDDAPAEAIAADDDDNVKLIGSLRVPIPLFNIYLNEADELSRRLATELAEWAMERHLPLPDVAIERAHSLAGNSATVGYTALCELARTLEHALVRVQALGRRGVAGEEEDARLFVDAADEIRRLLHQFAAGFLKAPAPELLERLAAHEQRSAQRLQSGTAQPPAPDTEADWLVGITAEDHVDADLFPIFEEEAQELLPQLAAALRDWARQPDDLGAADAAMRHLHTFKGGARLGGAMRLGELAHRLETRIERLATGGLAAQASEIESLLAGSDALLHAFEALRESDAQAYAAADAQALAQPVAPALASLALPGATVSGDAAAASVSPPSPGADDVAVGGGEAAAAPTPATAPAAPAALKTPTGIDWSRFDEVLPASVVPAERQAAASNAAVRVRASLLERMVNQASEVNISRARIEVEVSQVRGAMQDLNDNLERLRQQLHDIELQAETQMSSRLEATKAAAQEFDPLEIDRFTRFQELTRMMAESVNDVATVQRTLKRTVERAEDELAAQTRLTRDLQADLLRTRMVEFDTLAERLHRVVRQAAKETGKQIRLDIAGGGIELDRGMLERLTPAFEHLLRNAVTHGIESPAGRNGAGKSPVGALLLSLSQHGNEVGIDLQDDGAGLDLARIRAKAEALKLPVVDGQEAELIFNPGFSTADKLTELAGRGVGLDVVRTEVMAVGGRVEVSSTPGKGTLFSLLLPLTTAVTQVMMLRCGSFTVAIPATLIDRVRRVGPEELAESQASGRYAFGDQVLPFYWLGALLQHSGGSTELAERTRPVVVVRSAQQRLALHVDEVLGHQEAVVKHLGPQLSRMPGLAGMSVLASGRVALIYNPLVLAAVYGEAARAWSLAAPEAALGGSGAQAPSSGDASAAEVLAPLVLVVDDSLTVRRVTQRLLVREGYRVQLAKDGIEALERVAAERPLLVLSDIEMPRMDGFELVRLLRADAALATLPVVMITSRIAQKHRDHASALGVDHYLGKPYGEDELLSLVARYTRPRAAEAGAAALDFTTE